MNKFLKIIYPTVIALAVIGGIFLGINIEKRTSPSKHQFQHIFQPDKLTLLLRLIEKDYVDSINASEIVENTIPKLLDELDPHTSYIASKNMKAVNEDMRGNFSGIGVQFSMQNDTVMIIDVISGGPSKKLGILAGDRIVKVDDGIIAGIGIKSDSIVSLLRGKKGTIVNVSIFRPDYKDLIEFEIERGEIPLYSIDVSYMITNNIGFIKVSRFSETTYSEFVNAISNLKQKGAEKLIVDLRGNPGGSLQAVYQMTDEFLSGNKLIVYTEGKSRSRYNYTSTENGIWKEKDIVVLIDEFSASASEIFAGAIQDNDRGLVIGRRSFGKGLVQEQIPFFDGSALRLTVARFYSPSGRCIQKSYEEGKDEYYMDYHKRFMNNELSQKDSIHFEDSIKFYTSGGRLVYAGGGIMPDFFVPVDTSGINDFFSAVASKNLVYYFAFEYSDKNRSELNNKINVSELEDYLIKKQVFDEFISHIKEKKIKFTAKEYKESEKLLKAQLYAYICRNILGDDGFYPVIFKIDNTVKKSVELLKKDWTLTEISELKGVNQ